MARGQMGRGEGRVEPPLSGDMRGAGRRRSFFIGMRSLDAIFPGRPFVSWSLSLLPPRGLRGLPFGLGGGRWPLHVKRVIFRPGTALHRSQCWYSIGKTRLWRRIRLWGVNDTNLVGERSCPVKGQLCEGGHREAGGGCTNVSRRAGVASPESALNLREKGLVPGSEFGGEVQRHRKVLPKARE